MSEPNLDQLRGKTLERIERSERLYTLLLLVVAAVEVLFLWGFIRLAEFSNRVHVLILWSTVSTYVILILGLAVLAAHVSRNTRIVLKAIDLAARKP
jgi:hypothetical protein